MCVRVCVVVGRAGGVVLKRRKCLFMVFCRVTPTWPLVDEEATKGHATKSDMRLLGFLVLVNL